MPPLQMTVNGQAVSLDVPEGRTLADVLRYDLGLTGTKIGCGEGGVEKGLRRAASLPASNPSFSPLLLPVSGRRRGPGDEEGSALPDGKPSGSICEAPFGG